MVLILLSLLYNHDNLILKLHYRKNSYLDQVWLFIGRFKVGNVPGMNKKEVPAQFICRSAKFITLCILKKDGV